MVAVRRLSRGVSFGGTALPAIYIWVILTTKIHRRFLRGSLYDNVVEEGSLASLMRSIFEFFFMVFDLLPTILFLSTQG